jgi:hypothetical protein
MLKAISVDSPYFDASASGQDIASSIRFRLLSTAELQRAQDLQDSEYDKASPRMRAMMSRLALPQRQRIVIEGGAVIGAFAKYDDDLLAQMVMQPASGPIDLCQQTNCDYLSTCDLGDGFFPALRLGNLVVRRDAHRRKLPQTIIKFAQHYAHSVGYAATHFMVVPENMTMIDAAFATDHVMSGYAIHHDLNKPLLAFTQWKGPVNKPKDSVFDVGLADAQRLADVLLDDWVGTGFDRRSKNIRFTALSQLVGTEAASYQNVA